MKSLVHFSDKLVSKIRSVTQLDRPFMKPRGFWISVEGNGDGWSDWCVGEQWGLSRLVIAHDVTLRSEAKILKITSADELDEFHWKYRQPLQSRRFDMEQIDWQPVADEFQGIIIAPYIYERRLSDNCFWYYGWDCASGCVWDAAAIEKIEVIEQEKLRVSA